MKKILFFLMAVILLAGCSSRGISQVIAFGDEYVDNGNFATMAKKAVDDNRLDATLYDWVFASKWQGRWSNGPVAVEVLADRLNVPLNDYAISGAMSNSDNTFNEAFLLNTGLQEQIENFQSELEGKNPDPDALYFIHISDNDFFTMRDNGMESQVDEFADQAVANIVSAVTMLAQLGARQFMVVNPGDIANSPSATIFDFSDSAAAFQTQIYNQLPGELEQLAQQLDINITLFDYAAANNRIRENPAQYGLTNLVDPCQNDDQICANPDEYYYWDGDKPARVVNEIIGEAMAEQLGK